MLIIGFILHDRGFKIISMQTLFLTMAILIAFFPRLAFSIGFYLSIFGVFYIFLFLLHYENFTDFWVNWFSDLYNFIDDGLWSWTRE